MHTHMCLCTSVNGLVGIDKTPPVQVAGGHHTGASEAMYGEAKVRICANCILMTGKHHQRKLLMAT